MTAATTTAVHGIHVGRSRSRRHNASVQGVQCGNLQTGRGRAAADDEGHGVPLGAVTVVAGRRIVPAAPTDTVVQTCTIPVIVMVVLVLEFSCDNSELLLKSYV